MNFWKGCSSSSLQALNLASRDGGWLSVVWMVVPATAEICSSSMHRHSNSITQNETIHESFVRVLIDLSRPSRDSNTNSRATLWVPYLICRSRSRDEMCGDVASNWPMPLAIEIAERSVNTGKRLMKVMVKYAFRACVKSCRILLAELLVMAMSETSLGYEIHARRNVTICPWFSPKFYFRRLWQEGASKLNGSQHPDSF